MRTTRWIECDVAVDVPGSTMAVRLGQAGDRWVASVRAGASVTDGLGASARQALSAALAPLGARAAAVVMADPVMFGVSARILEVVG